MLACLGTPAPFSLSDHRPYTMPLAKSKLKKLQTVLNKMSGSLTHSLIGGMNKCSQGYLSMISNYIYIYIDIIYIYIDPGKAVPYIIKNISRR